MTFLLIALVWGSTLAIILPVNAFLAAGRDRGDRAAASEQLHAAA